ncbi:MAG: hypothetical protein ACHQHN_03480 [Sphingobacteriales bacterium]
MLKRSAALVLMMLYLGTVSGFALNLHYCFNRLSSVEIDAPAKTCTKAVAACKMKCCKDKHIEIKIKDSHETGIRSVISRIFNQDIPAILFGNIFYTIPVNTIAVVAYRGPPDGIRDQPIFQKNCTFRI